MLKKALLILCLQFGLLASAFAADPFIFTAIPDQDETKLQARFEKVATYLAEQLGVEVQFLPVKSYAAAVTAFRNNQVQLAWFGGLSGVRARELVPGSEAIAQGAEDAAFKTYFIAHKNTGLAPTEKLTDAIKGRTFTFGSKGSTSGRLMPEYYLRETFKAAPEEVFSRVGFSGNHSRTIALVASGAYEIGAVNFQVWESETQTQQNLLDDVVLLWETPTYPDYQWTVRGDVDQAFGEGFKAKLASALLNMQDDNLLASFPRSAFIPASNSDYEPIRKVGKEIGLLD